MCDAFPKKYYTVPLRGAIKYTLSTVYSTSSRSFCVLLWSMHSRISYACCVQLPGIKYQLVRLHRHLHGHHIEPIATVRINRVRLPIIILIVVGRTGKMNISLSPTAPENLVSRDGFGSPVPRQSAHLHTHAESGAYLGNSSRFARQRPFVYLNRHTLSCRYCFFYAQVRGICDVLAR